jgi:hypothetical protein
MITYVLSSFFAATSFPSTAPASASQPNGEYTAPLVQQTQPSFVPQSVALSGPKVLTHWKEGDPIPAGYQPQKRMRRGLLGGGIGLFAGFYATSALIGAINIDTARYCSGCNTGVPGALFIPVFGPLVDLAAGRSAVASFFLVMDFMGQVAGVTMAALGLALPKVVLVRNDLASVSPTLEPVFMGTGVGAKVSF